MSNEGKRIKYFRDLYDMTQEQLGKLTNNSRKTIGHYETGNRQPSVPQLRLISKALNMEIEEFLEEDDNIFNEIEIIPNDLGLQIIHETNNVLKIKRLIENLKEPNEKVIILIRRNEKIIKDTLIKYWFLRGKVHFYFEEYNEERLLEIKKSFQNPKFETNDEIICIYKHHPSYTITVGVRYKVISEGIFDDGESRFTSVEVITDGGMYGTYPKAWFEFIKKGDSSKSAPKEAAFWSFFR